MHGDGMRILVANDPRSYREVIGEAVRALRPHVEVIVTEPDDLDSGIARLEPHFVVCSRVTEAVQTRPVGWMVLYPDGEGHALVSITGRSAVVEEGIDFQQLLSVLDEVDRMVQSD